MAWGIVIIACYFLAAMGLLIMSLASEAERVPVDTSDAHDLPAEIPDVKKAA